MTAPSTLASTFPVVSPVSPSAVTRTKPAPVIDHRMFPHIMDMIVYAAPYESLLALRGASRDFRDRADIIMSRHLLLLNWATRDDEDDVPSERALLPSNKRFPPMQELVEDSIVAIPTLLRFEQLCQRVRVLELFDRLAEPSFWYLIGPNDFVGVRTLKVHTLPLSKDDHGAYPYDPVNQPWRYYPCRHEDGWFPHATTYIGRTLIHREDNRSLDLRARLPFLPGRVERAVITVRAWEEKVYESRIHVVQSNCPQSLREVVVVFNHRGFEDNPLFKALLGSGMARYALDWFKAMDLTRLGYIKYIFVDMPHTHPACLLGCRGLGVPVEIRQIIERTMNTCLRRKLLELQQTNGWSDDEVAHKLAAVETISRSEYQERVGVEQYTFETEFQWPRTIAIEDPAW